MILWVVGALLIMPVWLGMPVFQVGEVQLQSLMGHVLYGLALGLVLQAVVQASEGGPVASRT